MSEHVIEAHFPEKLAVLFEPHRYKILLGGRGGGKSWSIARALLIEGTQRPLRILCTREFQSSISDSVHKLLSDQITALGLDDFYAIEKATIKGENGTEFRFAGIKTNVSAIKSFEGIDIAWCEEAANISDTSWNTLIPTIRKADSEIWVSFNPELETDATYQRFVVNPPPDAVVVKINFIDNVYFPAVLSKEAEYMKSTDPEAYDNIWLGLPRTVLTGAVYSKEIQAAIREGRVTRVPYDSSTLVHLFLDLGWNDNTAIFMAQQVGQEYHVINYIEGNQRPIYDYVREVRELGYALGTWFLPHDARAKSLGTGRSIEETLRSLGCEVQIVPRLSVEDGINAVRSIFNKVWFDDANTKDGRQALSHYRYDDKTGKPIHDQYSHAADSFRYLATALGKPKTPVIKLTKKILSRTSPNTWMSR